VKGKKKGKYNAIFIFIRMEWISFLLYFHLLTYFITRRYKRG